MDDLQQFVLGLILVTTCFGIMYWLALNHPKQGCIATLLMMIAFMLGTIFMFWPISLWLQSGIQVPSSDWSIGLRLKAVFYFLLATVGFFLSMFLGTFRLAALIDDRAKRRRTITGEDVTATNTDPTAEEVIVAK